MHLGSSPATRAALALSSRAKPTGRCRGQGGCKAHHWRTHLGSLREGRMVADRGIRLSNSEGSEEGVEATKEGGLLQQKHE